MANSKTGGHQTFKQWKEKNLRLCDDLSEQVDKATKSFDQNGSKDLSNYLLEQPFWQLLIWLEEGQFDNSEELKAFLRREKNKDDAAFRKLSSLQKGLLIIIQLAELDLKQAEVSASKLNWNSQQWFLDTDSRNRSVLSRTLQRLEERGLIERSSKSKDDAKRTTTIKLCPEGRRIALRLMKNVAEEVKLRNFTVVGMTQKHLQVLKDHLSKQSTLKPNWDQIKILNL
ncbi:MAG TPA: hypothetical protein V6D10_01330 [Trichocoleus sp.]|jgi:DNA-binding MarR family transcriptional regulator